MGNLGESAKALAVARIKGMLEEHIGHGNCLGEKCHFDSQAGYLLVPCARYRSLQHELEMAESDLLNAERSNTQ